MEALIFKEVNSLPELRTPFDAKWMSIKDRVSDLKQKGSRRMPVTEYFQLCRELNEPEEKWQKWLLGFLHDLGIVVCFHDDKRLANDGVLDPQWVVDGIYKVVNEPILRGGDGLVTCDQVRALLPRADYDDGDVRVLIDLMEKFELCFRPNGSRDALVVPELMMEQEAGWQSTFPDLQKCLRFELRYDFLPEGLVPRFIVATHDLSKSGERWRSGAILRQGNNAALVRGDSAGSPPQIRIAVSGPVNGRRDLLAIIRRDFARIHASIPGLVVKEMVPVPGHNVEPLSYDDLLAAEEAGRKVWPVVVNGVLHEIKIAELLDGIEPKAKRTARAKQKRPAAGLHVENLHGDLVYEGGKTMIDDHSIHARDIIQSQVGQTLTNCTNLIQQASSERKPLLDTLQSDVRKLIENLPADKKGEAAQIAENLEILVKQATSEKPNRRWYEVSAEGLLEASKWVKDFTGNLAGTIANLGKAIWPDFLLPKSE